MKNLVKFTKSSGRYVKGDVAGFDAGPAAQLVAQGVAVAFDPRAGQRMTLKIEADTSSAQKMIAEAQADFEAMAADLAAREAALDAREAASVALTAAADKAFATEDPAKESEKAAGAPPKQGGAAK